MNQKRDNITPIAEACVRLTAVLSFGMALSACGSSQPTQPPEASAASGAEQSAAAAPDLAWHMRATFWDAVRARDALIEGQLAEAQRAADRIAQTDYARMLPADWKTSVGTLQKHASALTIAANLSEAAQELGRMALTCGECHTLRQRGPGRTPVVPLPWEDPPESLTERMERHQLGVDQLWDGLVLPSDNAWRSGTLTITRAPLVPPNTSDDEITPELHARIDATRELGKQARLATTYEERARVFGELISGCAQCHHLLRPARAQP